MFIRLEQKFCKRKYGQDACTYFIVKKEERNFYVKCGPKIKYPADETESDSDGAVRIDARV